MVVFTPQYFFLKNDATLVKGAAYSVILDFESERLFRLNKTGEAIIRQGLNGQTLDECIETLEPEISRDEIATFLAELEEKELILFRKQPNKSAEEDEPPLELDTLWIETTSRCNLRCLHCYAEANEHPADLPAEKILEIIDEATDLGFKKLQLTGGEPTLRPDIKDLVTYASRKGFETVEIFTNGTLLTKELIKVLSDHGTHVAMSIYSHKSETHDHITQVPGSHTQSLNSLKLLLAHEVPLRCAIVAMKQNEHELNETSYFLSQLGVLTRPPDPIRPAGRGIDPEYFPKDYGLLSIRDRPAFTVDKKSYLKNRRWNSCWAGKATVTSTGEVLPCVFAREQQAGNVNRESLSEIIRTGLTGYWEMTRDGVKVCKDCEYRYLCTDCRPWAYGFKGELDSKSPRCLYNPYTGEWEKENELTKTLS